MVIVRVYGLKFEINEGAQFKIICLFKISILYCIIYSTRVMEELFCDEDLSTTSFERSNLF